MARSRQFAKNPSGTPEYKTLVKNYLNLAKEPASSGSKYYEILKSLLLFPNQYAYIVDYVNYDVIFARNTDKILGLPPNQIKPNHLIEILPFDDFKSVFKMIEQCSVIIKDRQITPVHSHIELNYRYINHKNEVRWLNRKTMVIDYDSYGNFARMLSVCTDITHYNGDNKISGFVFDNNLFERLSINPATADIFTKREKEILQLLSKGYNSKKIAGELFISSHTVDTHRRNLLKKTECASTIELIDFAREHLLSIK